MSRPSLRRTPKLESLEIRQVLSTVLGPSPAEQYALSLINMVRTNPSGAATKLTTNLTPDVKATLGHFGLTVDGLVSELNSARPQPPLAWDDSLASSAKQQSQYQANNGIQTHQGPGEQNLNDRIASAGYSNDASYGENTYAYASGIEEAMQSFLFDWGVADHGHYNNLLQPGTSADASFKDAGVGLVNVGTNPGGVGPLVITQDFGSKHGEGPQIVGVVYDDPKGVGLYSIGSGQSGVTIDLTNLATGVDTPTTTTASGGFQLPVAANADYEIKATENGRVISARRVHVGNNNVEADFVHDPNANANASPAPAPAPAAPSIQAPAPAPSPVPTTFAPVSIDLSSQASAQTKTQSNDTSSQPNFEAQVLIPLQLDQFTVTQAQNSNTDTPAPKLAGWSHWFARKSG